MVAVPMVNMSGVLCLIMVVFSMLGMELFGGKLGGPLSPELGDTPPRTNFDYFFVAGAVIVCVLLVVWAFLG